MQLNCNARVWILAPGCIRNKRLWQAFSSAPYKLGVRRGFLGQSPGHSARTCWMRACTTHSDDPRKSVQPEARGEDFGSTWLSCLKVPTNRSASLSPWRVKQRLRVSGDPEEAGTTPAPLPHWGCVCKTATLHATASGKDRRLHECPVRRVEGVLARPPLWNTRWKMLREMQGGTVGPVPSLCFALWNELGGIAALRGLLWIFVCE